MYQLKPKKVEAVEYRGVGGNTDPDTKALIEGDYIVDVGDGRPFILHAAAFEALFEPVKAPAKKKVTKKAAKKKTTKK